MTPKLCLIEDDPIMGESLCDRFALEGLAYDWHTTAGAALQRIGREPYAAVISDIRLPDLSGEELFAVCSRNGASFHRSSSSPGTVRWIARWRC